MRTVLTNVLETLEGRRLLTAALVDGVLTVNGTAGNDVLTLAQTADGKVKVVTGEKKKAVTQTFDAALVTKVVIAAGRGNDRVTAATLKMPMSVNAGDGNDRVEAGMAADVVLGGAGNDTLLGAAGNDTLNGEAGNDALDGGTGDDNLLGGLGLDRLIGGLGKNRLFGNAGQDVYVDKKPKDIWDYLKREDTATTDDKTKATKAEAETEVHGGKKGASVKAAVTVSKK